ncbi:unnamed protein product (macronuclear) [Paramecium tetraurelia]|uniref:Transmembrane protein n=1 Tax=Paramecium tetraurelia TaxID=5888 RepID=A0C672_PARTE|nr:uncharacterized protein GSPATT00035418001 [Paramecium tetraurelia]CAK66289.1 unnamed protein product [Paramecium tetraurelia]|eukprot:XP_001433686.1 hypothetical protein (macronuclear) [Paramecium tetraurelia strain d4-2]
MIIILNYLKAMKQFKTQMVRQYFFQSKSQNNIKKNFKHLNMIKVFLEYWISFMKDSQNQIQMKFQDPFNRQGSYQISNDPSNILKSSHILPNRIQQKHLNLLELQVQHIYKQQYLRQNKLSKRLDQIHDMTHIKDYKKIHILKSFLFLFYFHLQKVQIQQILKNSFVELIILWQLFLKIQMNILQHHSYNFYSVTYFNRVGILDDPQFQIKLTETVDDEESEIGKSQYISKMTQTYQTEIGMDFKIKSFELSSTICYSPLVLQVAVSTPLIIHPSQFSVRV